MYQRFKLFTREEEHKLFRKMHDDGCMESRRLLIESQLALAKMLAARMDFHNTGISGQDDVLSLAYLACIHAVDRFDVSRGTRLSTTIRWAIRGVSRLKYQPGPFYVPAHGRYVKESWELINGVESLDTLNEGGVYAKDFIVGKDSNPLELVELGENLLQMHKALGQLSKREQNVINGRFFEHKTLAEIGEVEGVSRERIRQIERNALFKLREKLESV